MIRRLYLDLARQRLTGGDFAWLSRAALRYPLVKISSSLNRPLCGPVLATLIVTYRCNYGCVMCGLPLPGGDGRPANGGELGTAQMKRVIDQLREIGTLGVGFTGGEPLLRDDLTELLVHAVNTGMLTHLNTNGSLMAPQRARDLVAAGIHSVNVSLDSADPSTHDRIRQAPGAFDGAVGAVGELAEARGKKTSPRIKVVCVVMPETIDQLSAMVDLVAASGADCLEFVPVQPFAPGFSGRDGEAAPRVAAALERARERARGRVRIENSPRMTALFGPALRGEPSPVRCYAGYNSIAVDCFGQVFPCHPWANWSRPVHDLARAPLKDFWYSPEYGARRREIARCRECTLNGQAELSLLFQPWRRINGKT